LHITFKLESETIQKEIEARQKEIEMQMEKEYTELKQSRSKWN